MELLLTVSFVLGIFVLLFSWAVAVVLVKNDAFSDSRTTPKVATTADRADQVLSRAGELGIPATIVGETTETGALTLGGESVAISQLVSAWSATLPDLFDHAVGANSVVE